ncbi:MAG: glycosidase, partial [Desulfotomaculaceae bacterium]|nr:glycosidase [Desulfotomaculaceae bacterium]
MTDKEFNDLESLFQESIKNAVEQAKDFKEVDVVIGIPFYNEKGILPEVLKVLDQGVTGLEHAYNPLIVCVGDSVGAKMLESIRHMDLKAPHIDFLMKPGCNGRGNSIRAILEIADTLEADAVIFAADLAPEEDSGLQPDWIKRLIEPIREEYDFVVTSFQKHYFEDLLGSLFTAPLLEVFYGNNIKGSLSGVYAISHDTVEDLCANIKFWGDITQQFGIDLWLVSRAMRWNKKICEVELGAKLEEIPLEKLNYIFKENARSLFECIKRDENFWSANRFISKTPDIYRSKDYDVPFKPTYSTRDLTQFRYSYIQYKNLYDNTYYDDLYEGIEDIESIPDKDYRVEGKIWAEIVYHLLLKYWFVSNMCSDDILNALTFAFSGRVASLIDFIQSVEEPLGGIQNVDVYFIISSEVASLKEEQRKDFLRLRKKFVRMWGQKDLEAKPPLIPAHYVEFIPGAPIVLTKKIEGLGSKIVSSEETFNRLQSRYREAFSRFIHEGLGVPETACPETIIQSMREFMSELEKTMEWLLPGNLHTEEGTGRVVDKIFLPFHSPVTFSIKDEVFREMLIQFPPLNVMIPLECKTPRELIKKMDVRTAVSLANLVETRKYGDRSALLWMLDNLRPDSMGEVEIKPIILGKEVLDGTVQLGNISDLNKLTSRIVVRPLNKRMGGDYPKLRFCLFLLRHIMIAQNYDILWRTYARERKNLGSKIRNSLIGRYETIAFSAHNIYENLHHRELVLHFRALSNRLADAGHNKEARLIELMCDGYGLSQVLEDGTFLPCSAWSWASYSYKGGKSIPTPLSSHVEEKWFNHDFLEEIYAELGYDPGEIMRMVIQLIGEGRASENLLDVLLGIRPKDVNVVVQESQNYPPAMPLVRYAGNPVLSPIKEHPWESKYVLNTAAFRVKDRVYLLYRAYGDDDVSRIGLAVTDGYNVLERLPEPVFVPQDRTEKKGVEDPRVTIIDNRIYMLYTAYDGNIAQISAAAIMLEDLLNKRFDKWERKGLAFQDIWDKDAILFPDKINGKYIIYHRIEPSIWVTHLDKIEFPAPKEKHSIILGPRSGRMWDSLKIGAGSQPIKTKYGWLLIYHGVDRNRVYRLGVILADLANPERLLYRSPNPVLSPETEHEIGREGESWVPNVVFTCGAVPANDKEVLDAGDEILVYYGAADTSICLATGLVGDLIPEATRQEVEK